MVRELGKYAQLAILASLVEPKSLSELGLFWYNENGRFYKKKARDEINKVVDESFLVKSGSKLKANTERLVALIYSDISKKDLKELLCRFWYHPFSQHTYMCCEAIKQMFNNNPEKAAEAKISLVLNTPLILHQLQEKDMETYSLFVSSQGLENYTTAININAEKNMPNSFKNLKEKTDWLANLNKIVKNNGHLLKHANGAIKIKQMLKKKR